MCDLPPSRPRALSEPGFGLGRTVHIVGRWHGLSAAGRVATLIVGILMTWVVLLPALASLAIELEPASGPPGSEVVGRTIGSGAFPRTLAERRFSLSVLDADTSIEGAEPEAFIPIGNLRVTPEGDGVTEFVIPEIPVGSYTLTIRCAPCAPFSAGRRLLPVGELFVEEPAIVDEDLTPPGRSRSVTVLVAGGVVAVVIVILSVRSRRERGLRDLRD